MFVTEKLTFTTNGSGAATAYSGALNGTLYAIQWIDGDLADGVDATFTVTSADAGVDYALAVLTDANTDAIYYPRGAAALDTSGVAGTYDGTRPVIGVEPIVMGRVKCVVGSGGATKSGGAVLFIRQAL